MSTSYRIVYPRGDREQLAVALMYDYEEDEYDIASSQSFEDEDAAVEHMHTLAERHGLNANPRRKKLLD